MESKTDRPPLTTAQFLSITKVLIKRVAELALQHLDEDMRLMPTLNIVDEMYKKAMWKVCR